MIVGTFWNRIKRERRIRRDLRYVMALDDAILKDIGITRSMIEQAVRTGHPSD
ncbi:MAG TPA: DUF1127 domain-containing protein [Azospirillum sp.]|nr:DUF1127 domain-containing protein [Azospirillum sp.]